MTSARADDPRYGAGVLNMADAARYLDMRTRTFQDWSTLKNGKSILHVLPPDAGGAQQARVTFIAIAEAYVLKSLSKAGVNPRRIRKALQTLQTEFGDEYVLLAKELATDGIDVLWDHARGPDGRDLLVAGHNNQQVIREVVAGYLKYLHRDTDGIPNELELAALQPSKVVMSPEITFGQPHFAGTRVRVSDVAAMVKAGETMEVVADEFGISENDAWNAARILLGNAA